MKDRDLRLKSIKKLIKNNRIQSQEELLDYLVKEGFDVTQATLSRDLKLMKVGKVSDGNSGYVYTIPEDDSIKESDQIYAQDFMRGYISIDFSGNICVIKTLGGYAHSVTNALDYMNLEEVLGTIAGENCIFVCLKEGVTPELFMTKLKEKIPNLED
ncbi:MAG: ArgR family transcriptional regulator [Treponema sp.]|nr:ArgR family transcriptional regulator [Treponema sp.]